MDANARHWHTLSIDLEYFKKTVRVAGQGNGTDVQTVPYQRTRVRMRGGAVQEFRGRGGHICLGRQTATTPGGPGMWPGLETQVDCQQAGSGKLPSPGGKAAQGKAPRGVPGRAPASTAI